MEITASYPNTSQQEIDEIEEKFGADAAGVATAIKTNATGGFDLADLIVYYYELTGELPPILQDQASGNLDSPENYYYLWDNEDVIQTLYWGTKGGMADVKDDLEKLFKELKADGLDAIYQKIVEGEEPGKIDEAEEKAKNDADNPNNGAPTSSYKSGDLMSFFFKTGSLQMAMLAYITDGKKGMKNLILEAQDGLLLSMDEAVSSLESLGPLTDITVSEDGSHQIEMAQLQREIGYYEDVVKTLTEAMKQLQNILNELFQTASALSNSINSTNESIIQKIA